MRKILIPMTVICMMASCTTQEKKIKSMNPFLEAYTTPFEVPPFDKILNAHYLPAFEEGIKQHNTEIKSITDNQAIPDFENTIEALDGSGALLGRVNHVFSNLKEALSNDSLREIARKLAPVLSQHSDAVNLNAKLFARVKQVYENKSALKLNGEQSKLLDDTYKHFVRGGANLTADQKKQLKQVNEELSLLDLKFGDNMLDETNAFKMVVDKKEDLDGLSENVIAGAVEDAKEAHLDGKWVFTLQKPSWIPFVTYAKNRSLREKLYKAMYSRSNNSNEHDNKSVILKLVNLRLKKANIMGFDSWSAYVLDDCMAKTPANVYKLLHEIWTPAINRANEEAKDIQAMIDKEGGKFKRDYRVTTLGGFMRKYWLDELPMIYNLLRGDMKLVGVRPLSNHFYSLYSKELQQKRNKFKPGLLPPFYADMPKTLSDIENSEMKYLIACEKRGVFITDLRYLFLILNNILIKKARSG